jgi:hypothetical protein
MSQRCQKATRFSFRWQLHTGKIGSHDDVAGIAIILGRLAVVLLRQRAAGHLYSPLRGGSERRREMGEHEVLNSVALSHSAEIGRIALAVVYGRRRTAGAAPQNVCR